jgi:ADP-heptose:LPS heptosyltransferase
MTNPSWNAAGLTSVTGLACLLAHSDLLITLDTGTMHVGRGVDVPMVVIGHAANPRHEWLSSSNERACVIRHDEIPCAGCRRRYCTTRECMDYLTVDEAARGVDLQLTRFAPSGASRQSRVTKRLDPRGGPRQLPGLATSAERSSGPPGQPP